MEPNENESQNTNNQEISMTITFILGPPLSRGQTSEQSNTSQPSNPTPYTRQNLRPLSHRRITRPIQNLSALDFLGGLGPLLLLNMILDMGPDINLQGQPRTSDACISSLQTLNELSEKRRLKHKTCAICLEEFPKQLQDSTQESQQPIIRLPCHHLFHQNCIIRWLKMGSTCPSCRYELLTENEDYNVGVRQRMAARDLELTLDTDDEDSLLDIPAKSNSSQIIHDPCNYDPCNSNDHSMDKKRKLDQCDDECIDRKKQKFNEN